MDYIPLKIDALVDKKARLIKLKLASGGERRRARYLASRANPPATLQANMATTPRPIGPKNL